MKILGIHADFIHSNEVNESSVSLLVDGKLVFCVAEERLSRIKVDGKFPAAAIKDTLKSNGLTIDDIDHVATTCLHPTQTNKKYLQSAISTFFDTGVFLKKKIKNFAWFYAYNALKTPKNISVEVEKRNSILCSTTIIAVTRQELIIVRHLTKRLLLP